MKTVALTDVENELHQMAASVAAGERFLVTDGGRPVAELRPPGSSQWRRWDEIDDVFGEGDDEAEDRDLIDQALVDPWLDR